MAEIICAVIAAAATIICACIGGTVKKMGAEADKKAQERAEEGRLQLRCIAANNKLTVGIALALKHGQANGEVEEGLKDVKEAQEEYKKFLEDTAIDHIRK